MATRGPGGRPRLLTNDQARSVRERAANGVGHGVLAREYGVSVSLVSHIVHGRRYDDAGGPVCTTDKTTGETTWIYQ